MPISSLDLGFVQAIFSGLLPPSNTQMIWYDTNLGENNHKAYDTTLLTWVDLSAGSSPDASTTIKGISKLSVAPVSASNPIAVGDNDPRNSDSRTPITHASSHTNGSDDIQDATASQKGLLTDTDWNTFNSKQPAGSYEVTSNKNVTGGYVGLTAYQINFKNTANTFTNYFTNSTTASRTYTFQDRNGTIADDTDLGLKANLASPAFTGTPIAPTAAPGTNTTQLATTAFVLANGGGWSLTGNATANDTSFIGTTDNQDFLLKTNNTTRLTFTKNGSVYNSGLGGITTNTAFGLSALTANTTGLSNSAFGNSSLPVNTIGVRNSAYGNQTLNANIGGTDNNAFGFQALFSNVSGLYSNAFGAYSLKSSTADKNTAFGDNTLQGTTSGEGNTAIGYGAGYSNVTGANNVFIGRQAGFSETGSNKLYISNSTTANPLIYGDFGTSILKVNGSLGVGISPTAKFHSYSSNTTFATFTGIFENGNGKSLQIRDDGSVYNLGGGSGNAGACAFGELALTSNTTGTYNTAFGSGTLRSNTTSDYNCAFGAAALQNNTGQANCAFGIQSLFTNLSGQYNIAYGGYSLLSNTFGQYNVAVGHESLKANISGWGNTAVGTAALINSVNAPTTGFNSAFGFQCMLTNTTGIENAAFGYHAMYSKGVGDYNAAFGSFALRENTGGSSNAAFGAYALGLNTGGSNNTGCGQGALYGNLTGSSCVGLGFQAGRGETGSSKLYIDNQNRGSEANARAQALIYGVFNATASLQSLTFNSNVGINTATFGTNAVNVFAMLNGTAPTTNPANTIQAYAEGGIWKYQDTSGNIITI